MHISQKFKDMHIFVSWRWNKLLHLISCIAYIFFEWTYCLCLCVALYFFYYTIRRETKIFATVAAALPVAKASGTPPIQDLLFFYAWVDYFSISMCRIVLLCKPCLDLFIPASRFLWKYLVELWCYAKLFLMKC